MGKCCLHASSFIFDRIVVKVAGNQDRHKSLVKFDFGLNQTYHFGVTCPWVWTWIPLKPVNLSWSNFMCSIIGVGERLHKVLGQIKVAGNQDRHKSSDEFDFGPLVSMAHLYVFWNEIWPWHTGQVSDRCPLGYLLGILRYKPEWIFTFKFHTIKRYF